MTKILCLHGFGTSADILENQLGPLMDRADSNVEFVFLEGEVECSKAHGIPDSVPGPYLCYNSSFTPSDVRGSLDYINEFIEDEGPFDGIMGFSQGGSLTLSYLVSWARENPGVPPPFKFAVLMSAIPALSPDGTYRNDLLESLTDAEVKLLKDFRNQDLSAMASETRALCETTALAFDVAKMAGFIPPETDSGNFEKRAHPSQPRVMHPATLPERITIPTVHTTGKRDHPTLVQLSQLMTKLCDQNDTKVLQHAGGHDVPRKPNDVEATWSAIEWAIGRSQQQSWSTARL